MREPRADADGGLTDARKPFLETAPWLIAVFARPYAVDADGERRKHYYVKESVGLATGFLLAALHHAGLATLTHTPSPMGFLCWAGPNTSAVRADRHRPSGRGSDGRRPLDAIARFVEP
jgi:hypothetical protein